MAMFNDLFELLADVPRLLVLAWVGWFAIGALIVMWYRRADEFETASPAPAPRQVSKPKPVSRPSSSPDLHSTEASVAAYGAAEEPASPVAERTKPAVVIGDPYGDLATLLDPPAPPAVATAYTPPPAEPPRAPADSPILSSSGSPVRRANSHEPGH